MKKYFKTTMYVMIALCISAVYSYGRSDKTFSIRVKYLDGDKIISNAVVYFSYYDEKTSALVDTTANTGNGKIVRFNVPLNDDGSSYAFIVLFSKEDVTKAKKANSLRMYCKPPGENCEYLELSIQKKAV